MQKTIEIFENEEAEKFLEYFSAYKEFSKKTDYIRRILASCQSNTSCESFPQSSESKQSSENHSEIGISLEIIREETDFTPVGLWYRIRQRAGGLNFFENMH